MNSVAEEIALSDAEVAAVVQPILADPLRDRVVAAATRHNARIDSPEQDKKGSWNATASGVRVDANQGRHPWSVVGRGLTSIAAVEDLLAKIDERSVDVPAEPCPYCHQPLPPSFRGASARYDAPD